MEPFKVHILGCGSALPTTRHNASSQVVELRGKLFMIDCGEGTQIAMRRSRISFANLQAVFISHLHGDHCLGLIGMISTFGLLGRTQKLHVYAHPNLTPLFEKQMEMFCPNLEYEVELHPIDPAHQKIIYEDKSLTVETIPLDHRVACCGFLFREKPTLPHIRREMIDAYGIPVSQINNIKAGASWELEDGTIIPHEQLTRLADPPRTYPYCSDTSYLPNLPSLLHGTTLLYHEATYPQEFESHAEKYCHSTAPQAAKTALDASVGTLCLGHFSGRIKDEDAFLKEATDIFPNTILAHEGLSIPVR